MSSITWVGESYLYYARTKPSFPLGSVMDSLPAIQQLYRDKGYFVDALVSYKRLWGSKGTSFNWYLEVWVNRFQPSGEALPQYVETPPTT